MAGKKKSTQSKTEVRIPKGLHEKLTASASEAGRSLNLEIVARIKSSYRIEENQVVLRRDEIDKIVRDTIRAVDLSYLERMNAITDNRSPMKSQLEQMIQMHSESTGTKKPK